MANVYGDSGGRTGPYWRRQLGTTLPGERTGAQLHILNMARARLGLPPLGGPIGEQTPVGSARGHGGLGRGAFPIQHASRQDLYNQAQGGISAIPEQPGGPALQGGPTHLGGDVIDPGGVAMPPGSLDNLIQLPNPQLGGFGRPAIGGNGHADLRNRLLQRFQGQMQAPTSRDALRQYVMQHQQRRAIPGQGRQAILPRRQPRRAVPY